MYAQALVDGVFSGSIYALIALSMTITYQPTRIMNFAQGEGFVLGGAVGFVAIGKMHIPWPLAMLIMILAAAIMGYIMERMVMLPVQLSGSRFAWIIATLAAALIFQAIWTMNFVGDVLSFKPPLDKSYSIAGAVMDFQQIAAIVISLGIIIAYDQFLRRTLLGRAIRATAHNSDTATILGIPTRRIIVGAFVLSTIVVAVAGFLWVPEIGINPASGLSFTIQGFTAAVIGGVGSPRGALLGGLIVGLLASFADAIFGGLSANIGVFLALGLILVLRPAGLFGKPMEGH